ncbi:MAG: ABC transporter permease [Calditrichaceae bacterium]
MIQRILYLIQKEFREILREKAFIGIIFVMPFVEIVLLGFAITTDVKHVPLAIVDLDHSQSSRRIIDAFSVTESFEYVGVVKTEARSKEMMDYGEIKLALVIPPHFERDLKNGIQPKVQAIVDGVDGNSAGIALGYVNQISVNLQKEWLGSAGLLAQKTAGVHITEILPRMLYNPSLESVNNIVPGVIAVLLTIITAVLTGMSIVREKEIGTLEQLMVTPIRSSELIIGKTIPFLIISFLLLNVGILAAGIIFGIWIKGNLILLYVLSMIFSLSTLGLGIFASTMAKTQQQAMFVAWFFSIFAFILSGFFIPIQNMPDWVQMVTYLNPLRYYMVVIREIYLKGTSAPYLVKEALAMLAFGLIAFGSAVLRFQKRLS